MLHEETNAAANRNDAPRGNAMKFIAIAAAMALLAGCAVTMPLREIAPSGYALTGPPGGDLNCTATFDSECLDGAADDGETYRHAPNAGRGKINPHDDTELSFIFNSEAAIMRQDGMLR